MRKEVLILTVALLISLTGCGNTSSQAESYLEGKYGENFIFQGGSSGGIDSSATYWFTSDSLPDANIMVYRAGEEFRDNYTGVKYKEQTEQLIRSMLTECFGPDVFVIYQVPNMQTGSGTTFEEYKKSAVITYTAIVRYSLTDRDDAVKRLEEVTKRELGSGGATIYFDADIDLSTLTSDNYYTAYLEKKLYDARLHTYMNDTSGFSDVEWQ